MSHKDDFEKHKAKFEALSVEDIKEPYLPIRVYAQEAEDLVVWAKVDQDALVEIGYNIERFVLILEYSGALHYVDAQASKDRNIQKEAIEEWKTEAESARGTKAYLQHVFRFAFDERPDLLRILDGIQEGNTNADLVQDMMDLAILGKENQDLLGNYMDIQKLNESEEASDRLGALLAQANGERHTPNASIELRNKVYTVLKEEVDHLRKCGKFLFWKNEKRLKGYSSAFMRRQNQQKKRASEMTGSNTKDSQ